MTTLNKLFVAVFGAALTAVGLSILWSGNVTLPSRTPPLRVEFTGLPLALLGSSPLLVGLMSLALVRGVLKPQSRVTYALTYLGMAMLGLAFLLAPKV